MASHREPRSFPKRSSTISIMAGAAVVGAVAGAGSIATTSEGRDKLAAIAKDAGVATGMVRRRSPQPGDYWGGCNDARAAGTAPIYRGEPGYRDEMDGDGDGEACEPYR